MGNQLHETIIKVAEYNCNSFVIILLNRGLRYTSCHLPGGGGATGEGGNAVAALSDTAYYIRYIIFSKVK